jgi:transposase-like protein
MTDGERIVALPRRQQHAPPQPCKTLQAFARLPRRQQAGVTALLSTQTVRDAAGALGINEATLYRWLTMPAFQAGYREARYVVMDAALAELQKACTKAAQTLVDLLEDAQGPTVVRLRAAQVVLDTALKSRTVDELEARIAALEAVADREETPQGRRA